jgi:hypothetical protein
VDRLFSLCSVRTGREHTFDASRPTVTEFLEVKRLQAEGLGILRISQIFCEHCELLGIHWTQSSFKNISISHRESVAILDSFVGPKR